VIRLKAPLAGETVIEDRVQGRVVWQNADLDDMIILRSDGTPVYNHAVVVDDHDMGVTHVMRGVDHLTNSARQVQIYRAMGWDVPVMAHIPLIHGADGAKLSKRHGALGVEAYRDLGFLPEALRNYLCRLGWSHGDAEIFSTEQAIAWFDIDDVNKAPARLDMAKLADVNSHYIRQASEQELIARLKDLCQYIAGGAQLAARFAAVGWDRLAAAAFPASSRAPNAARAHRWGLLPAGDTAPAAGRQGPEAAGGPSTGPPRPAQGRARPGYRLAGAGLGERGQGLCRGRRTQTGPDRPARCGRR
jgi:glutamyl-tRNA synthetase